MNTKTKIIATIGPASDNPKIVSQLIEAGMNVGRINFSHSNYKTHKENIVKIRRAEKLLNKHVGILADLGGPKIRTGKLPNRRPIRLKNNDIITFAPEKNAKKREIPITYPNLAKDLQTGNQLLLDDGKISVVVEKITGNKIIAKVLCGGLLNEHKGINLPGIALNTSAITEKDQNDLVFALSAGVDFIGVSFVQHSTDIQSVKKIMHKEGRVIPIIAKIERQTAIQNIEEIMGVADIVMVARGDLGVETPLENVPILQKKIISLGTKFKCPVIIATQMLESMIKMDRPTRAEVSDVANSVFDGADAVMLSAETAMGHDPANAVKTMKKIIEASEKSSYHHRGTYELDHKQDAVVVATTRAACFAAEEAKAKAICVFTMTGKSALYISKQRPNIPIIGITNTDETARRLALYYGISPVKIPSWKTIDAMIISGIDVLKSGKLIRRGDKIVIVCGTTTAKGATNMIKVLEV